MGLAFYPHHTLLPRKDKKLSSTWISFKGVFKVNILKRKFEVLTQQQKKVLKIDCLKCANMWSLWCRAVKRQATSEARLPKGKPFPLHSPKQFTPAIKMKWCLVLWNYLWKIQNNENLFLYMAFPALPWAPPLPHPSHAQSLLWAGRGNSRSQYRGQPAGHCYSRPP